MVDLMGIVNDTGSARNLRTLLNGRSLVAIPFGGRYRIIDFHLSNMVNSGVRNVGILVKSNYRSLISHVRSPKNWDLDRKSDGIFVLPPEYEGVGWGGLRGDLEILKGNIDYLKRSRQKYVAICDGNILYNIDYSDMLKKHIETGNDITLLYKSIHEEIENIDSYSQLKLEGEKVTAIETNINRKKNNEIYMGTCIIDKDLLIDVIYDCIGRGEYDFLRDGIVRNLSKYSVGTYEFVGEFMNIHSATSYFKNSMKLLDSKVREDIFDPSRGIHTRKKDSAPIKYGCASETQNTLVANGCIIKGSVKNSILFRDVEIKEGARINNCIIMQSCTIGEGAVLENVIIDKDCIVEAKNKLIGSERHPIVIEKKSVI